MALPGFPVTTTYCPCPELHWYTLRVLAESVMQLRPPLVPSASSEGSVWVRRRRRCSLIIGLVVMILTL